MTTETQCLAVGLRRGHFWIVSVLQQRAMARFARNDLVLGWRRFVHGVLVAFGAAGASGVREGPRRHVGDCSGTVVAVLTEIFGHEFGAHHRKEQEAGAEQCGQSDQMLEVLEGSIHFRDSRRVHGDAARPGPLLFCWYLFGVGHHRVIWSDKICRKVVNRRSFKTGWRTSARVSPRERSGAYGAPRASV